MTNNKFQFGEFSSTALDFLANSDAFLNICVGSIRSGKTITSLVRFLCFMGESPHSTFAMAGKTMNSLRRNVIEPFLLMLDTFGIEYHYNKQDQEIHTATKTIVLFGIDKMGSEDKIKGFTCGGTLFDEITIMDPDGVRMLISRNSLDGALIFATCNPGNPNNFIYQEYISNKSVVDGGICKTWDFLLEDNKNLSREYIENLKKSYDPDSVFYKRNILNQWVSGQGMIFSKFNDDNITNEIKPLEYYDYVGISSDYGTSTTTCYSLIGVKCLADHNEFHVIDEFGYDAETEGATQTDAERVNDIYMLQEKYGLNDENTFYCSHDAGSLKAALIKDDRITMDIETFTPDTLECITTLNNLFYLGYLTINERCTNTILQIKGYEWDRKAAEKGKDLPVKKDDHYIDSMRGVIMTHLYGDDNYMLGGFLTL